MCGNYEGIRRGKFAGKYQNLSNLKLHEYMRNCHQFQDFNMKKGAPKQGLQYKNIKFLK